MLHIVIRYLENKKKTVTLENQKKGQIHIKVIYCRQLPGMGMAGTVSLGTAGWEPLSST